MTWLSGCEIKRPGRTHQKAKTHRRLTEPVIRDAVNKRPTGEPLVLRDSTMRGFSARIGRTGKLSYALQYADPITGKQKLYTLTDGDFAEGVNVSDPAEARDVAHEIKKQLEKKPGFDPFRSRGAWREASAESKTVGDLCDAWLRDRTDKRSHVQDRMIIKLHIRPQLGDLPLVALDRQTVARRRNELRAEGKMHMANRVVSLLSAMWNYAGEELRPEVPGLGWLDDNLKNPASKAMIRKGVEIARKRKLTPDEFRRLFDVVAKHGDTTGTRALWLIVTTAARKNEVLKMRWMDVDLTTGTWTRPAERMKAGEEHVVYLSARPLALLKRMSLAANPAEPYVFPGKDHGNCALFRTWQAVRKEAGLTDVRLHDLRRTGASMVGRHVGVLTVSDMLAHHDTNVTTKHYLSGYDDDKRAAFDTLGKVIDGLLDDRPRLRMEPDDFFYADSPYDVASTQYAKGGLRGRSSDFRSLRGRALLAPLPIPKDPIFRSHY